MKSDRNPLIKIFRETKKAAEYSTHNLDPHLTKLMIAGTKAYRMRKNGHLLELGTNKEAPPPSSLKPVEPRPKTSFQMINQDTLVTARQLTEQKLNPLVLNMANKISIGGGVENGAKAQEETMFRCSNYHLALYPHGKLEKKGQHQGRMHYKHQINEFGSYYTPQVQVFRDASKNYGFIKPFSVSCLAVAGYDLSKPKLFEPILCRSDGKPLEGEALKQAFLRGTKIKIQHILEVALLHGHDSLVLGAISCGAFKLPDDKTGITAQLVAQAYEDVLMMPRYQNRFKNITFSVLVTRPDDQVNYDVFTRLTQKLSGQVLLSKEMAAGAPSPESIQAQGGGAAAKPIHARQEVKSMANKGVNRDEISAEVGKHPIEHSADHKQPLYFKHLSKIKSIVEEYKTNLENSGPIHDPLYAQKLAGATELVNTLNGIDKNSSLAKLTKVTDEVVKHLTDPKPKHPFKGESIAQLFDKRRTHLPWKDTGKAVLKAIVTALAYITVIPAALVKFITKKSVQSHLFPVKGREVLEKMHKELHPIHPKAPKGKSSGP